MRVNKYGTIVLLWLLLSCGPPAFDGEEDLLAYIREPRHGYLHQKTVNDIDFSLLYKPTDLMVAGELSVESAPAGIDSLRHRYGQYMYFVLSMSAKNRELLNHVAGDRSRFGAMVNALSFYMDRNVHCFTPEKDTLPMIDFIYPRMYGMSRSTDILLVYPAIKNISGANISISALQISDFVRGR